ncbi:MAG TPA: hypothetical protein ENK02_01545 [Planctomycetes bacterium]|nr:hypothetical protein [Planctomycetota bacterium]
MAFRFLLPLLFPALLLGAGFWDHPQEGQEPTAPFQRKGNYLDDWQACADCHVDEAEIFAKSRHDGIQNQKGLHACETCHGPGELHADEQEASQITFPKKLPPRAQLQLCARCHRRQLAEHGGPMKDLLRAGKRCTDCHSVHAEAPGGSRPTRPRSRKTLNAQRSPAGVQACLGCHISKKANLEAGPHRILLTKAFKDRGGCEACHGKGSGHVQGLGDPLEISRPDRAPDGLETCLSCHKGVDPVAFHWKGRKSPLIGSPKGKVMTCTTCHSVHGRALVGPRGPQLPAPQPSPLSCLGCHAPASGHLRGSVHEGLLGAARGCVGCHPGGEEHAWSGGRPELVFRHGGKPVAAQNRTCLNCHGGKAKICGFSSGLHAREGVGCLSCHSPTPAKDPRERKRAQQKRCGSCHPGVRLAFAKESRHPIEGSMVGCASCHDPHRTRAVGFQKGRRMERTCKACHKEYRGPFVFPHHADKGEGCLACHSPHGSNNPKLLKARSARDTCLACHADLPSFHDQSTGSKFRNCLTCHRKIHGSNRNRNFLK